MITELQDLLARHVPTSAVGRITMPGKPVQDRRYCSCGATFTVSTADMRDNEFSTDRLLAVQIAAHMAEVIKAQLGQTELHEDIKGGTTVMWTRQIVPLTHWDSKVMKNG